MLELTNPLARLSQTETKGMFFSCFGELLWYLAQSNELGFIKYYIKNYDEGSDDGKTLAGAYGPRIFNMNGINQYHSILEILRRKPDTRQAVIQIIKAEDIISGTKDVPCTCTLQFAIRQGCLHMFVSMRSNDAYLGLTHDIFAFTMFQEILAKDLGVKLGIYKHSVASLHIYEKDIPLIQQYDEEGWQEAENMPEMPTIGIWPSLDALLKIEKDIRDGKEVDLSNISLDPYWLDLLRLLQIFALSRSTGTQPKIDELKGKMISKFYNDFINRRKSKKTAIEKK